MPKTAYILAFTMLCSILGYSQQITFYENVNYRANTLLQSLNKSEDSLLLESKTAQILKVDIFNDDFSESIEVFSNSTKINLKTLPIGSFVIQAKVDKQWIIMYLEKTEEDKITSTHNHEDIKITSTHKSTKAIDNTVITSSSQSKSNKITKKENSLYYWVIIESNSSFGSSKSMRLEYKDGVERLISKNKLELKSNVGKNNTLIIYEVYNKSKFMDNQFRNPTFYKSEDASKFLNIKPLYASNEAIESDF